MKRLFLLSIVFIVFFVCQLFDVSAQGVGINASGNAPNSSAALDVDFTTKGALMPRMTTLQRDAISSPVNGLLIFNTDCGNFNYYFNGSWLPLNNAILPAPAGTITGSATVCQGQNNVAYTVPTIANAASYTWAYSGIGATIAGATNSVTVNFSGSATSGNLTVLGSNPCGNGTVSTGYAITVNTAPALPTAATHVPSTTQIVWNWNTVSGATGYKWGTTNNYNTATDNLTSITHTQTGLACNTACTLYVWAYNSCGNSVPLTLTQTTSPCGFVCGSTLTDSRDNKTYTTVQIGAQCWMGQNLNYGTQISQASNQTSNQKWCANDDGANCTKFGGLYQWTEATGMAAGSGGVNCNPCGPTTGNGGVQGICPSGWHVPSDNEWTVMERAICVSGNCTTTFPFLGGCGSKGTTEGAILKAKSTDNPSWDGTNTSNFSALPGGYSTGGNTVSLNSTAIFYNSLETYYRSLDSGVNTINNCLGNPVTMGFSIRCLKD